MVHFIWAGELGFDWHFELYPVFEIYPEKTNIFRYLTFVG